MRSKIRPYLHLQEWNSPQALFFLRCFWLLVILKRDTGSVTASWHQCAWCLLRPDPANFTRIQSTFLLQTTCVEVSVIKQVVYCNSTYFFCNHIIKLAENEQKQIKKTPLHLFSVIMEACLHYSSHGFSVIKTSSRSTVLSPGSFKWVCSLEREVNALTYIMALVTISYYLWFFSFFCLFILSWSGWLM